MPRTFTLAEARALLPQILMTAEEIIPLRADLVAAARAQRQGSPDANLADVKAMEARLSDLLDRLGQLGAVVKGWAPLLVDLPAVVAGREVLVCWLEGDRALDWYHDPDDGFAGRRPLRELPA